MDKYPDKIGNDDQLDELLSRPGPEVIEMFSRLDGDLIFLGVAGKDRSITGLYGKECM